MSKSKFVVGGIIVVVLLISLLFIPSNQFFGIESHNPESPLPIVVLSNNYERFEITPISCLPESDTVEFQFNIENKIDDDYRLELHLVQNNIDNQNLSKEAMLVEINAKETITVVHEAPFNSDFVSCQIELDSSEKIIVQSTNSSSHDQEDIEPIIKTGTNSGFCIGYCSHEFIITTEKITHIQSGRDVSDKVSETPFSKSDWNELVNLIDFQQFQSLPDQFGCPGCADVPVEWIEISYGDKTKKIEFESRDIIPEIEELFLALQEIRKPVETQISSATNFQECIGEGNPAIESYPRQCRTVDGKHFVESISENKECEMSGGIWGIWSNSHNAKESCNLPTTDVGMECSDSSQCQSFCQAKEYSKIDSESTGMCYGYELALCMQEVTNGIVQPEWCQ